MSAASAWEPRVVHALPGRLRLHLARWDSGEEAGIEHRLSMLPGVRCVQANSLTGNVLVTFDPATVDQQTVLAAAKTLDFKAAATAAEGAVVAAGTAATRWRRQSAAEADTERGIAPEGFERPPKVIQEDAGPVSHLTPPAESGRASEARLHRARIAVRGVERDPELARAVVERLQRRPGVMRAVASPLTGRVLVEFRDDEVALPALLAAVAELEAPPAGGQETPDHALNPLPLRQSAGRVAAATAGLGLVAARRSPGLAGPLPAAAGAAQVAAVIGLVQAFPLSRNGLRQWLGRDLADVLVGGAGIVALALSGNPLGLAVAGAEALRLLTEVVPRQEAWHRYEERAAATPPALPGAVIRLEAGDRVPLAATVVEGAGTAIGQDGLPAPAAPGTLLGAGDVIHGGPLMVALQGDGAFVPQPRSAPLPQSLLDRYAQALGPLSLITAAALGVATGSPAMALAGLALVNPRAALIGAEAASTGATARVLRAGVTVVGTRTDRRVRRPDVLLVDGPRLLTDGLELASVLPLDDMDDDGDVLSLAAAVAAAAGAPWGGAFRAGTDLNVGDGAFDGISASAALNGARYVLEPVDVAALPSDHRPRERGALLLGLRRDGDDRPLAAFALRPRLAAGAADLCSLCRRHAVELAVLSPGNSSAAQAVAQRAGMQLLTEGDLAAAVRSRQAAGKIVAVLSDSAGAAAAFDACDLAIGLSSGRSGRFAAAADLLAPDLPAVGAILESGARAADASHAAVLCSAAANVAGVVWGFQGQPGFTQASRAVYVGALAALAGGWARLRGGERPRSALARLADPRPERWGRRGSEDVLRALGSGVDGLSAAEAAARVQAVVPATERHALLRAVLDQVRSPINAVLAAGAGLSLVLGSPLDVLFIAGTIGVGIAVGVWQEWQADQATAALERLGAASARLLRDGRVVTLPAVEVVPGDILVLAPGDRVAADARLLRSHNLEVDEAALTGESLPVPKAPDAPAVADRIVLEGSDVTVGTARAVVVAVGRGTRMGATGAALAAEEDAASPLGARLSRLLAQILPVAGAGGAIVILSGLLRGRPLLPQLAIGATIAIAAVPEGLPLLSGVGQASVARRLASRQALVRRIGAVEALGRVDVACTDKTGTLTVGKPALTLVADLEGDAPLGPLPGTRLTQGLAAVLRAAGLASPHPEAGDARSHPTDIAVVEGVRLAGLRDHLLTPRTAEAPFDPARAFHATVAGRRLYVKGATEALLPRCTKECCRDGEAPLDAAGRERLHARAVALAGRGLRVLMVAEGPGEAAVGDPRGLTALGFVGISDPLRPDVPAAVQRCREAGVRIIMLTGDHPATARAIAAQAGILDGGAVLTGLEIAELEDEELDSRLERAAVVARVTPLDKLRIVESLQRRGHTVAMTGDGVNDAPALRLADVGVAMGRGGTEVARQAADVVLADDDFATLVEALVEGRSFWRNIRRALALLLGGNLGELGLVVGASVLGMASPLVTRQILAVNLITDALPALAVAMQPPADRNLAGLAREGAQSLDRPLRDEVLKRGALAAGPSLAAFLLALPAGLDAARAVALGSIVSTQLVQTLAAGRSETGLSRPVVGAVAASGGLLLAALTLPALQRLLLLRAPTSSGWLLIGGSAAATAVLGSLLADRRSVAPALPPARVLRMLPAGGSPS